jgi:hypothetical protein
LKLSQEWREGEIKENGGGSKFNYDVFDILRLRILVNTPNTAIKNKLKVSFKRTKNKM